MGEEEEGIIFKIVGTQEEESLIGTEDSTNTDMDNATPDRISTNSVHHQEGGAHDRIARRRTMTCDAQEKTATAVTRGTTTITTLREGDMEEKGEVGVAGEVTTTSMALL